LRAHTSGSDEFMAVTAAATEAIFGCEPRELSLLYTLFYIASSGNEQNPGTFERNFDTTGGAQMRRFNGGAQRVPLRVAAKLGSAVVLNAPVRSISQSSTGVTVVSDAETATGQRVIVAIPPTLTSRIEYRPALPALRDQLTQHTPNGTLMKFEAIYSTPFWRAKGLNGQAVSENGPVKVTFDTSPPSGTPGIMMGFIGGHDARVWEDRPANELRAAALQNLANYFGNEALTPDQVLTFNWSTEVWNRGCPVAVLGPGTLVDFGTALRQPVGRIHWAGTETSNFWNGYMDGAVRSGERAASEVLPLLS
jgi:monoamine oxidase